MEGKKKKPHEKIIFGHQKIEKEKITGLSY